MRSVISLHIGAPGIRVGAQLWDLLNCETRMDSDWPSRAFREDSKGDKHANALFLDTDPELKVEMQRSEFLSRVPFLSSSEGAGGIAMHAHYANGKDVLDPALEVLRKTMEACETVGGLALFFSLSGGTGSGLTTLLMDRLEVVDAGPLVSFLILPEGNSVVEPYNFVLGINTVYEKSPLIVTYDNRQTGKAAKHLGATASMCDVNSVMAQTGSHLFAQRDDFGGSIAGLARISNSDLKFAHPSVSLNLPSDFSVGSDASNLVESLSRGKCFEFKENETAFSHIQFRGDWSHLEAETYVGQTSSNSYDFYSQCRPQWSQWTAQRQSLLSLSWSKSVLKSLKSIERHYSILYAKRAFVHWYVGVGTSEGEFSQAGEDFTRLISGIAA